MKKVTLHPAERNNCKRFYDMADGVYEIRNEDGIQIGLKSHDTVRHTSFKDIAELYGFPVTGNEAKDDALIILRTFLLLRERLEDSRATISEKDIANKEDRDSFFRIINWIDTEYCSRSTNLIARTEGSHSVSYMTINYDEIITRISKWC